MRRTITRLVAVASLAIPGLLVAPPAMAADEPPSVVEDFAYPGAAQILAEHGIKVLKGDGRIRYVADCDAQANLFRVESLVGSTALTYCFEVRGPRGFVTVDIPNVYLVRGAAQTVVATATFEGQTEKATVPPNTYVAIGGGQGTHTLVELRATSTAALPAGEPSPHPFVARVDTGDRACSGALVAKQWLLTTKTCFAADGNVAAGAPPRATTAVLGRPDLEKAGGEERTVVSLVPRTDRDVVLAKLDRVVDTIAPIAVATAAPAAGATVQVAGFGRTGTEWVGTRLRTQGLTAGTVDGATLKLSGASTCKGDAGGPAFQVADGKPLLLGLSTASWQHGCFGVSESRDGAVAARTDDLASWIKSSALPPCTIATIPQSGSNLGILEFYLSDSPVLSCPTRPVISYGNVPMVPIVGDWDGDGLDTVSAYLPTSGTFLLSNNPITGQHQYSVRYGDPNAVPLVGDWDGDGKDNVGVRMGNRFYLRTSPITSATETTISVAYGDAPDKPIIGDWDGDGKDNVGIYRGAGFRFYLRTSANTNPAEVTTVVAYGNPNSTPLVGDWDNDGTDNIGVRMGNGFFFRMSPVTSATETTNSVTYGTGVNEYAIVGDWDGDGVDTQGVVS